MGLFSHKKKKEAAPTAEQVGPSPVAPVPEMQSSPAPEMPTPAATMPQAPTASPMSQALSEPAQPFSLPDLPPMPEMPGEQENLADPIQNMSDESLHELPELPDLPSFENHPELDIDEVPTQEPMQAPAPAPVSKPVVKAPPAPQRAEVPTDLPEAPKMDIPNPVMVNEEPIFVDVEHYQDILADLSMTKEDLQHIHSRSKLNEYEGRIDSVLETFQKNIMQAKKKLNQADELLFNR